MLIRLILVVLALIAFALVALSKILDITNVLTYPVQWTAAGLFLFVLSTLPWDTYASRRPVSE